MLAVLAKSPSIETVDITGGAPEMNEAFRTLVEGATARGVEVIDRCNLTVLAEPGMEWVPDFLKEHKVRVVASLPCYSQKNVDTQRGSKVFDSTQNKDSFEDAAVLVSDMTGFTSGTRKHGIVHVASVIVRMRQICLPMCRNGRSA